MADQKKPSGDDILTTREASNITGLHASNFNNMILKGELEAEKNANNRWEFTRRDFEEAMAKRNARTSKRQPKATSSKRGDEPTEKDLKSELAIRAARNSDLESELAAANVKIQDLQESQDAEIADYKLSVQTEMQAKDDDLAKSHAEITTLKEDLQRERTRVERLEAVNDDLRAQVRDSTIFLRTSFQKFIDGVVGTSNATEQKAEAKPEE